MSQGRKPPHRLISRIAAVVLLGGLLVGCGGEDEDPTAADGERPSVRVVLASSSLAQLPWFVAEGAGYFEELGVDVEFLPDLPETPQQLEMVLRNDADISHGAPAGLFTGLSNGRPVAGFGVGATGSPLLLILRNEVIDKLAEEGVTPESPIADRMAALQGLKIGTTAAGGGLHALVLAALDEFALEDGKEVTLVPADTTVMFAALQQGRIDGLVFSPPTSLTPVREGTSQVWVNGTTGDVTAWTKGYQQFASTSLENLEKKREAYVAVLAALEKASRLIQDDPEAARDEARDRFADLDQELYDQAFDMIAASFPTAFVGEAGFTEALEQFNATAESPVQDVTFADAFDAEIAGEAQRLLEESQ